MTDTTYWYVRAMRAKTMAAAWEREARELKDERDQAVRERDEAYERGARLAKWMEEAQAERDSLRAELAEAMTITPQGRMTDEQVDEWIDNAFQLHANRSDHERAIYRAAYAHCRQDGLREAAKLVEAELERERARAGVLQAKIDRLMLEYCPGEMTPEQMNDEWAANQQRAPG